MKGTQPRIAKYETRVLGASNRLKLCAFGLNVQGGVSLSLAEGSPKATWEESLRLTKQLDSYGIEATIPLARWRGYGGAGNLAARCFETFTWASGLAAATHRTSATRHLTHTDMIGRCCILPASARADPHRPVRCGKAVDG